MAWLAMEDPIRLTEMLAIRCTGEDGEDASFAVLQLACCGQGVHVIENDGLD